MTIRPHAPQGRLVLLHIRPHGNPPLSQDLSWYAKIASCLVIRRVYSLEKAPNVLSGTPGESNVLRRALPMSLGQGLRVLRPIPGASGIRTAVSLSEKGEDVRQCMARELQ